MLKHRLTPSRLSDVINTFRSTLGLMPVPLTEGPFLAETLKIPYTYCWSPSLVPKPPDWRDHIDVSGFLFQSAVSYEPTSELEQFLKAGPAPVYIGFGSIVVEDPDTLLSTVLEAVKICEIRAIISKGWSNLKAADQPDNVLFLGDCPHDWLFQHVSVVVHHGGAGTTAAGLRSGKPTIIVPFFGDQPFWGDMIAKAGAGPKPIPHKKLTATNLAEAIQYALSPEVSKVSQETAARMQLEDGVQSAVASFHRHLSSDVLRCDLVPTLPAVYEHSRKKVLKLSGSAADTLLKHGRIKQNHLSLYAPKPISIENRRWDSVTGAASVGIGMAYDLLDATNDLWYAPHKLRKGTQAADDDPGEGSSKRSETSSSGKQAKQTAKMVGASAMSIPKMAGVITKGFAVETPLVIAEGMRATPRLYGETVKDHKPITGVVSGFQVAATVSLTPAPTDSC